MNQIAIIGCGALGSRHLQALANLTETAEIYVVEPSQAAREIAEKRFAEAGGSAERLHLAGDLGALPGQLDVVIVATNANVRRRITEDLLARVRVRFLILEKVLFQSIADINAIEGLLERNEVECYVNHARRMNPFFQGLKQRYGKCAPWRVNVVGSNWGLACNGIHLVDIFANLSDQSDLQYDISGLDAEIHDSKRSGFKEISGGLRISGPTGVLDMLSFANQEFSSLFWSIATPDFRCYFVERPGEKVIFHDRESGWAERTESFEVLFQSQLSNRLVDSLLAGRGTELTSYKESAVLNRGYLAALLQHFSQATGEEQTICPIT